MRLEADPRLFPKNMLNEILDDERLNPIDKLVAVTSHSCFRRENHEMPSKPIHEYIGIGKRKLENHLKRLEEFGYITRETGKIAPGINYPAGGYWM